MPSSSKTNFSERYRSFMERRNGPDQLARDMLILAVVLVVVSLFLRNAVGNVILLCGLAALAYSYFRLFSSNIGARSSENSAYVAKRNRILGKVSSRVRPASDAASAAGRRATRQVRDRDHRYFACPSCGQEVRVPKGAGKIRVTCPKCGEKFERKA